MDDKVIMTVFSDGAIISRRELLLADYYDESHPEIDDGDYIKANHIHMVEQHICTDGHEILARNYYNQNGEPYCFEKLENGRLEIDTKEKFCMSCNIRISFFYDEPDGYIITVESGSISTFQIPDTINGTDVIGVEGIHLSDLQAITVNPEHPFLKAIDGVLFTKDGTELLWYPSHKTDTCYKVPLGTKIIGEDAVCNQYLKRVELPDGLEYIVQYGFALSRKLEQITIPKSLKTVYFKAFLGCSSLKEVYYAGTEKEWEQINFTAMNEPLLNARIYYHA